MVNHTGPCKSWSFSFLVWSSPSDFLQLICALFVSMFPKDSWRWGFKELIPPIWQVGHLTWMWFHPLYRIFMPAHSLPHPFLIWSMEGSNASAHSRSHRSNDLTTPPDVRSQQIGENIQKSSFFPLSRLLLTSTLHLPDAKRSPLSQLINFPFCLK